MPALLCFLTAYVPARGATITFEAKGVQGVSGFVSIDDSTFNGGTWQGVLNSQIMGLSLTVFGQVFTLADVTVSSSTFIDSSGPLPRIMNGGGRLAANGSAQIALFPDGFGGTTLDGDASLAFSAGEPWTYHPVRWDPSGAEIPEPSSFALLATGLAGLGLIRRWHMQRRD